MTDASGAHSFRMGRGAMQCESQRVVRGEGRGGGLDGKGPLSRSVSTPPSVESGKAPAATVCMRPGSHQDGRGAQHVYNAAGHADLSSKLYCSRRHTLPIATR